MGGSELTDLLEAPVRSRPKPVKGKRKKAKRTPRPTYEIGGITYKMPSKKRDERSVIEWKLDTITSLIVRRRDGESVTSGSKDSPNCSHLIKRGKHAIRWDLKNCNQQTAGENYRHNNFPEVYTRWFLNKYGTKEYNRLVGLAESPFEWAVPELREMLAHYEYLWDNWPVSYSEAELRRLGYYGVPTVGWDASGASDALATSEQAS